MCVEDVDLKTCPVCGHQDDVLEFDVIGACPGNLFCTECSTEFNSNSGEPALLCGKCASCQDLRDVRPANEFECIQEERIKILLAWTKSKDTKGLRIKGWAPQSAAVHTFLSQCGAVIRIWERGNFYFFEYDPDVEVSYVPSSLKIVW